MKSALDEQVESFARLLGAIHEEELRLVRAAGRSLTEYYMLQILALNPGSTVTDLTHRLVLVKSSVSSAIDALVKHGLVRRSQGGPDRRRIALHLTRKGKRWVHRSWTGQTDLLLDAMAGLSAEEQRLALEIIRRVTEALERRRYPSGQTPECNDTEGQGK